jgi:hypothetical protein
MYELLSHCTKILCPVFEECKISDLQVIAKCPTHTQNYICVQSNCYVFRQ